MKKRNETKDDTNSSVSESSEIDDDYSENLKSDSEQKISEQGEEMMPIDPRRNYFYIIIF